MHLVFKLHVCSSETMFKRRFDATSQAMAEAAQAAVSAARQLAANLGMSMTTTTDTILQRRPRASDGELVKYATAIYQNNIIDWKRDDHSAGRLTAEEFCGKIVTVVRTDVHIPVTEEVQEDDKEIVKSLKKHFAYLVDTSDLVNATRFAKLLHTDKTSSSLSKVQDFISARERPQKRARRDT